MRLPFVHRLSSEESPRPPRAGRARFLDRRAASVTREHSPSSSAVDNAEASPRLSAALPWLRHGAAVTFLGALTIRAVITGQDVHEVLAVVLQVLLVGSS